MGPIEKEMKDLCATVLAEVDEHLQAYPMGEAYFCRKAGCSPYIVSKLREGIIVNPKSLDKIRAFIEKRENAGKSKK